MSLCVASRESALRIRPMARTWRYALRQIYAVNLGPHAQVFVENNTQVAHLISERNPTVSIHGCQEW